MPVDVPHSFLGTKCLPNGSRRRAVPTGPWIVTSRDVTVLSTWIGSCSCPVRSSLIASVTCTHFNIYYSVEAIVKCTHFWFYEHPFYEFSLNKFKVPFHAVKAFRGSRSIAPFILQLDIRWKWMADFTQLPLYAQEITRCPLNRVWTFLDKRKISCHFRGSNSGVQPSYCTNLRLKHLKIMWCNYNSVCLN